MADQPFIEELPPAVSARLKAVNGSPDAIQIQVASDMIDAFSYGERWLVVTDERILVLPPDSPNADVDIPISSVSEVITDDLVGGARLEVKCVEGGIPLRIYYSGGQIPKFAEVARGIERIAAGKQNDLPTFVERTRCRQCGRWLPEKDGICPFCIKKWETIKRIASFLKPFKAQVVMLILVTVATTLLELIPPYVVKLIIDDVLTPKSGIDLLLWFALGLLGARLVSWGLSLLNGLLRADIATGSLRDIRSALYQGLQFLPLRFYEKRQVGNLISRFLNDSDRLEMFLLMGVPFIVNNVLMFFGILGLLFYLNWELTLYVLLPVPVFAWGGITKWEKLRRYWGRYSVKWSYFSTHLNESIGSIREVKSFAQEEHEASRFNLRNDQLREAGTNAERVWFVFYAGMNLIMSSGLFLVWYVGGRQILSEELSLGLLMAFISYIWMFYQPLQFFSTINNFLTMAFAGAERVFEIIDAQPEPFLEPRARPMPRIQGGVCFKEVSFAYNPGKPVLREIDLTVEPGEMIGLVGRSGAGKSTLINLICRFYDVDGGVLEIDGCDIRGMRLGDLRSQIGLVSQECFLFNGSIGDNIGYGNVNATFEEIVAAARTANAHEFIVAKNDGYDTRVGERGAQLSGGERQRISIARAILHDPRILILDEATSAVDTPTEQKLQQAIARLVRGRTTFAIAHRLSTLRYANRLVVLDEGSVMEIGTHEELIAREGLFHNLVAIQSETSAVMATTGGVSD